MLDHSHAQGQYHLVEGCRSSKVSLGKFRDASLKKSSSFFNLLGKTHRLSVTLFAGSFHASSGMEKNLGGSGYPSTVNPQIATMEACFMKSDKYTPTYAYYIYICIYLVTSIFYKWHQWCSLYSQVGQKAWVVLSSPNHILVDFGVIWNDIWRLLYQEILVIPAGMCWMYTYTLFLLLLKAPGELRTGSLCSLALARWQSGPAAFHHHEGYNLE